MLQLEIYPRLPKQGLVYDENVSDIILSRLEIYPSGSLLRIIVSETIFDEGARKIHRNPLSAEEAFLYGNDVPDFFYDCPNRYQHDFCTYVLSKEGNTICTIKSEDEFSHFSEDGQSLASQTVGNIIKLLKIEMPRCKTTRLGEIKYPHDYYQSAFNIKLES